MQKVIPIRKESRSCDGCTACCDGWLVGEAHGYHFWPGRRCHFVRSDGCSIYDSRPHDPCHTYKCEWLINDKIPEWLKPSMSNIIITERDEKGFKYWEISETGGKMPTEVLSWLFQEYVKGNIPFLKYQLNSGWNVVGSNEFFNAMSN